MKPIKLLYSAFSIALLFAMFLLEHACKPKEKYTCVHRNLSKDFDFKVSVKRFLLEDGVEDSLDVVINVANKHIGTSNKIHLGSRWFFEGTYTDCNRVRSYITGVNKDTEIADNDFGDIAVADLNFDGKDDFALKKNRGGNSGPDYAFYVQDGNGDFKEDKFLTDSVGYFPNDINAAKKQITTLAMAGALAVSERLYSYDIDTKKWKSQKPTLWQEYQFSKLSDAFDFKILTSEVPQPNEQDSVHIAVSIFAKKGVLKQEIKFGNDFFEKPFTDNNSVRSYTTGFNKNGEVKDSDYGNLVVADFDFDGLEDLAIKSEQGGNGGPQYKYYLQDREGIFIENKFLSNIGYFPEEFVPSIKTLIYRVRANAYQYQETVCRYKPALKQWVIVKQEIRN